MCLRCGYSAGSNQISQECLLHPFRDTECLNGGSCRTRRGDRPQSLTNISRTFLNFHPTFPHRMSHGQHAPTHHSFVYGANLCTVKPADCRMEHCHVGFLVESVWYGRVSTALRRYHSNPCRYVGTES